jgi:hypothetical protein
MSSEWFYKVDEIELGALSRQLASSNCGCWGHAAKALKLLFRF